MAKNKFGLVLEGGGMRGLYTAGVLDVFMENNIWADGVVGVSAGALHGISYASRQPRRSARYSIRFNNDKRYKSFKSLIKTGNLFNEDFCYHEIPEVIDVFDYEGFKKYQKDCPFYAVCTDLETGKAKYIQIQDMRKEIDYLRASASLPLVSNIIDDGVNKLLDGGTVDSIPVRFFEKKGYNKMVVIVTQPKGYRKKPSKVEKIVAFVYRKYPKYVKATKYRYRMYNNQLKYMEKLEREGKIFVIRPTENLQLNRIEKDNEKLISMYKLGRRDAKKMLEGVKNYLER